MAAQIPLPRIAKFTGTRLRQSSSNRTMEVRTSTKHRINVASREKCYVLRVDIAPAGARKEEGPIPPGVERVPEGNLERRGGIFFSANTIAWVLKLLARCPPSMQGSNHPCKDRIAGRRAK
ncbi:hypothetical protein BDK51DRAFT_51379 [Blyttiomyces helicus]|uniref:Uncharacterized protein n=1 Tax=Blyttiomyces helicus TaxID=388810 RepID=A0A4P9VY65_9FUNG|nr:hypothetical protein BDK51DRAFT_51379 [Blyttiomyces helicus]|eukprot:RKO83683.1 hypothetical protein BDK51DRAFT_51379 [Blyttiomyces helicus]